MNQKLITTGLLCVAALCSTPVRGQDMPTLPDSPAPAPSSAADFPITPSTPTDLAPAEPTAIAVKEGKKIRQVLVRGAGVDRDRVTANMSLQQGGIYSQEKEEADIKSLFSTGIAENVTITSDVVDNMVNVIVTVQPRAALAGVEFEGNTVFNSKRLQEEVELSAGGSIEESKLQEARNSLVELYQNKGYQDISINYEVAPAGNGFSKVIFKVDEGQKGVLGGLRFEGNTAVSSGELKKVMKVDNRGFKFWSAPKIDSAKLNEDIKKIEALYQQKGYVNARVSGVEEERSDDGDVTLVVKINEGNIYNVESVGISGAKSFSVQDLTPPGGFNLETGRLFDGAAMKADVAEITRYYKSRGYADAQVAPQVSNRPNGAVAVNYAITEGRIYQIDKINIRGNENTRDEVIRRELAINPGDNYNQNTIELSEQRLRKMGYFEDITLIPSDSGTAGYKDVNISVKEGQTGQVNFGAGFSSIDNLVGFVDLRQRNFDIGSWPPVGAGQNFYMTVKAGSKRKDFSVGWYEPWLFDRPLGFGVEAFYTEKTYLSDRYDQTNIGGDIYFRKKVGEATDVRLQWLTQQVTIDGIDKNASEALQKEAGEYLHNEVTLTWNYDTRDDLILPRKGMKFAIDLGAAFGDVSDQSIGAEFSKPVELPFDCIFTVSGRAETVSGDPPIFERTFLGGARDLRGFDFREVGPKDEDGEPLGGDTAWFLSAELTFPIVERVRGAVFYDIGEVSGGPGTKGGGVNSNYGIGLRLNLPVLGPLKLDYGIPLSSDEFNDNGGTFQISVDTRF